MGINQALFTSSARGISKGGGLGLHSYNRTCSDMELREFEQGFCHYSYQGDSSEIPNLPKKMLYKKIDGDRYLLASVTYLGKDYLKEQGRMGNLLSHMYSFERKDLTKYPMEFCASPDFRYEMESDEVDGSRRVEYLSEVSGVRTGTKVMRETVQAFLEAEPWRIDFFRNLLAAVFHRDAVHKVILSDSHEHILMWLAAVEFALPLQCAIELSFSSYEENPMISEFDIRGMASGLSVGSCEEYAASGQYYVFDGNHQAYPKFDITEGYFQYGILFGIDSIQGFCDFMKSYGYYGVDMDICAGYNLYQMVQGGMDLLGEKEFQDAVSFESKYGDRATYRQILENQFEKIEGSYTPDLSVLKSIYVWLIGYFQKPLTIKDLEFAVAYAVRLERYGKDNTKLVNARKQMWEFIYETMVQSKQKTALAFLLEKLKEAGLYEHIGEFSRYLIQFANEDTAAKRLGRLFTMLWEAVPQTEYRYFDAVVETEADRLAAYDGKEQYREALLAFLKVQELGYGQVHGKGMEKLIAFLSCGTNFEDLKPRKQGLIHRKKENRDELEQLQAKAAFEAFNYAQKHNKNISIANIRLLHLGKCIQNAFELEKPLEKVKTLRIYSDYPVDMERISHDEFEFYLDILCETIFTMQLDKSDYMQLLTYWILEKRQKSILMQKFLSGEMNSVKKDSEAGGLISLLSALKNLNDEEYTEAFQKNLFLLKESQCVRAADLMKKEYGADNEGYRFWRQLIRGEKPTEKSLTKKFPKFGKR